MIRAVLAVSLLTSAGYRMLPSNPDPEAARRDAIAEARTGCLHSSKAFMQDPLPDDWLSGLSTVPEHEPYALPCRSEPHVASWWTDSPRFVDALAAGMSFDDARCLAAAPAPIRIEHVHVPPRNPPIVSRSSIRAVTQDGTAVAELVGGWPYDGPPDPFAPLSHELDAVIDAAQTCEAELLHVHTAMPAVLAVAFAIGPNGRVAELAFVKPSREVGRIAAHFARHAGQLVLPAEVRTCVAIAVRAMQFTLPAAITRVEVTASDVSMQPAP